MDGLNHGWTKSWMDYIIDASNLNNGSDFNIVSFVSFVLDAINS